MRAGKLLLMSLVAYIFLSPAFATVERGSTWDRYCDDVTKICTQTIYSGAVNTLDENDQYAPFEDVTGYSWSPEAEGWNFTGTFKDFTAWFILKPFVQHSNGNWYDYSDIKDAFPEADFKDYVQTSRGSRKFSLNITGIPQALADNVERIAFAVTDSYNLGWDDVRIESPCIIIKEKVAFCYQDILDSDLSLTLYNKSVVFIGNIKGNTSIYIDPTITLNDVGEVWDTEIRKVTPTTEYGADLDMDAMPYGEITFFGKWDLMDIPADQIIDNASVCMSLDVEALEADEWIYINVHHVYPFPKFNISDADWVQGTGTGGGGGDPCTDSELCFQTRPNTTSQMNYTWESSVGFTDGNATGTYYCWNVSQMVKQDYDDATAENITIWFNATGQTATIDYLSFDSSETVSAPFIIVWYSPFGVVWSNQQSSGDEEYDPNGIIQFNITWVGREVTLDVVTIETNITGSFVNYTMTNTFYGGDVYNFTVAHTETLGVNYYSWKSWANDTTGSYVDVSDSATITITQNATNPVHMNMSGYGFATNTSDANITVTTAQTVDIYGFLGWADAGTAAIWIDGALQSNPYANTFGGGSHSVLVNTTGNTNYTANATGFTFYVISLIPSAGGGGGGTDMSWDTCEDSDLEIYPKQTLSYAYPSVAAFKLINYKSDNVTFTAQLSDNLAQYCYLLESNVTIFGLGSEGNIRLACTRMPENLESGNVTFAGGGCAALRGVCVGPGCVLPSVQIYSFFALFGNIGWGIVTGDFDSVWTSFGELAKRTFRPDLGSLAGWLTIYGVAALIYLLYDKERHRGSDSERVRRFGMGAVAVVIFLGVLWFSSWLAVDVLRII